MRPLLAPLLATLFVLAGCAVRRAPEPSAPSRGKPSEVLAAEPVPAGDSAPPTSIEWLSYEDAFARAASEGKPIVVVFTAGWCPHCRHYADNVLADARVAAASRDFLMVRVDIDERRDLASRHQPDGGYVPRTLFFASNGTFLPAIGGRNPHYRYFLDTSSSDELLSLMGRALATR